MSAHNEALRCASALFTLYDSALLPNKYNDEDKSGLLTSIKATSNRVVQFATSLVWDHGKGQHRHLVPFRPLQPVSSGSCAVSTVEATGDVPIKGSHGFFGTDTRSSH